MNDSQAERMVLAIEKIAMALEKIETGINGAPPPYAVPGIIDTRPNIRDMLQWAYNGQTNIQQEIRNLTGAVNGLNSNISSMCGSINGMVSKFDRIAGIQLEHMEVLSKV